MGGGGSKQGIKRYGELVREEEKEEGEEKGEEEEKKPGFVLEIVLKHYWHCR